MSALRRGEYCEGEATLLACTSLVQMKVSQSGPQSPSQTSGRWPRPRCLPTLAFSPLERPSQRLDCTALPRGLLSPNTAAGVYRDLSLGCQQHLVFVKIKPSAYPPSVPRAIKSARLALLHNYLHSVREFWQNIIHCMRQLVVEGLRGEPPGAVSRCSEQILGLIEPRRSCTPTSLPNCFPPAFPDKTSRLSHFFLATDRRA